MSSMLLHRLESFSVDQPGCQLTFAARLARENGWSLAQAERVVVEYKRFLYLAAVAGHAVTPSEAVDQAWHLHLCYTRSYWQDLCEQTLGFPLHHGPTQGGRAEDEKFVDWYQKTLESYRHHFGEAAPAEIWPEVKERFAPRAARWVDASRYWIVPKAWVGSAAAVGLGCYGAKEWLFATAGATHQASVGIVIFVVLLVVCLMMINRGKGRGKNSDDGGSSSWWWFGGCGGGGSSGCSNDSSGCSSSSCGGGGGD